MSDDERLQLEGAINLINWLKFQRSSFSKDIMVTFKLSKEELEPWEIMPFQAKYDINQDPDEPDETKPISLIQVQPLNRIILTKPKDKPQTLGFNIYG